MCCLIKALNNRRGQKVQKTPDFEVMLEVDGTLKYLQ
jgi:hypothetical protein